ncbi:MAG: MFS transporter [Thermoleophilia bacterium]|nr:MFS transporter [Thermoleophilia bacterium]
MTAGSATGQKLWTRGFLVITLENFLIAVNFWLLMTVVSKFATDRFGVSTALAGLAVGIFIIGAVIGRSLCGKWIHRIGQTRTIYVGVVVTLALTLVYLAAGNTLLLLLVRFLHGVAFGAAHVAAGTIVASVMPKERYGEGIGYFTLGQTVATGIGPFIGMLLIHHGSFDSVIIASAVASALGLALLPFLTVKDVELTAEQTEETKGFRIRSYIEPNAVPVALIAMVVYLCYSSVISFLALYAEDIRLVSAAGVFFVVFAAAVLVTRPLVGRRFDVKGENSVMYPAIPVYALGLVIVSQARHGAVLLLAAAVMGLGFGALQAAGQATAIKVTAPHRLGLATSTYYTFADVGAGVGPLLCGLLIPLTGYRGMYIVVAAVAAGCLVLYYALYGRHADHGTATP